MRHNIGIMQGRLTKPKGRGIQFFPFDNWKQEFHDAKDVGLDEIEFIFDYDDYWKNPLWTEEGIKELGNIMSETGVRVNAICFDYFMRRPFYKYHGDEKRIVKDENTQIIMRILGAMRTLGISLIEIPSVDASSMQNDCEKEDYAVWLKNLAIANRDIRFGMETDLPPYDFLSFIENINLTNVGANYDSGNSSGMGYDLYEEVTVLREHIFNIHIKDRKLQGTTVQLGTGNADFDRLFRGLKEIRYSMSFILQAARGIEGSEAKNISRQKEFVETMINRYGL